MLGSAQDCQAQELTLAGQAVALEALEALEALALMPSSAPWLCAVALRRDSLSSSWLFALSRTLAATVVLWTPLSHSTCKTSFKEVSFIEAQLDAEILSSAHVVLITPLAVL